MGIRPSGSPPRVRGKAHDRRPAAAAVGITPACAGKRRSPSPSSARSWDHPRVCGEKRRFCCDDTHGLGSPPRVRGKDVQARQRLVRHRITPACAGKRAMSTSPRGSIQDHPRVCGEKLTLSGSLQIISGSPPRVRGKERQPIVQRDGVGITPACAGKRTRQNTYFSACKDHPRVCGEKQLRVGRLRGNIGSPPRVRGKGHAAGIRRRRVRITPACAGKSY